MGKFILGLILGALALVAGAFVYFLTGMAPVATAAPAMPFEKYLANHALRAQVDKQAPKTAALQPTEQNLLAGADVYRMNCRLCHGMPNQPESPIAKGMYPHPPQLFHGHGVTDDPPGETYWKVKNGIRLTAMPSFSFALDDTQMWQVAQLLANANKLPPPVQQSLGTTAAAAPASGNPPKE